jgi:photosystem II stability/assembly factor-like uncharacterized protein
MAIGLSHGGSNIYSSAEPSREVLVGTKDGVVAIERDGDKWRVAHHALTGLHISSIIVEPQSGSIFAGAFFGSIHASPDGGRTWERRDSELTQDDVYSLASLDINGKVRIFAGTQPAHLFFSDNLGFHWKEFPALRAVPTVDHWTFPVAPHIAHTKFITFDPYDIDTIYACIEQGALLRSTDAGQSWKEVNTLGFYNDKRRQTENFYDVHKAVIDPRDANKIFVTGGAGLYVSKDRGEHWERWTSRDWAEDVYPDGLVLNPRLPDIIFVAAAEHNPSQWHKARPQASAGGRIYRSTDAGQTWEMLRNGLPDQMRHEVGALCLEEWGNSFSVFAGTTGGEVYGSDDGGNNWSLIMSGLAPICKFGHESLLAA